ncbi:hypothetical protein D3C87_94410 [compost metagenome]
MEMSDPQIVEASISGLFKTILMIIGALILLRFLGRVMIAKRNLDEERADLAREKAFVKERNEKLRNFGKVTVSKSNPKGDVQDVDYEEIR